VAQWVKCPTCDFGSGHDLRVFKIKSCIGLRAGCEACLRVSLSLSPPFSLSPSLKKKNMNNPIKKCSKDMNRYLTKKDIQVVNKPMTWCLTLYIITELQIKINPFLLLVGIQNRIATLEGSLATSYKAKYIFTI